MLKQVWPQSLGQYSTPEIWKEVHQFFKNAKTRQHYIQSMMILLDFSTRFPKRNFWTQWQFWSEIGVTSLVNKLSKWRSTRKTSTSTTSQQADQTGTILIPGIFTKSWSETYPWSSNWALTHVFSKHLVEFSNNTEGRELAIRFHQWSQTLR